MIIIDDPLENNEDEKVRNYLNNMVKKRLNSKIERIIIIHGDSPEGQKIKEFIEKRFKELDNDNQNIL